MKINTRYVVLFVGALIGAVYLHELGHAVAGWTEGIAVVPTPAKEYVLQPQLGWNMEIWIALGGIAGTTVAAIAAAVYFWRKPCPDSEAIQVGAFLPLGFYSLRFLLAGRGHDGLEWQAAQTALGLRPTGHAIDVFLLVLLVVNLAIWVHRIRPRLASWLRLATLATAGIILLVALQAGNNAVFDHLFPVVQISDGPTGLDPR